MASDQPPPPSVHPSIGALVGLHNLQKALAADPSPECAHLQRDIVMPLTATRDGASIAFTTKLPKPCSLRGLTFRIEGTLRDFFAQQPLVSILFGPELLVQNEPIPLQAVLDLEGNIALLFDAETLERWRSNTLTADERDVIDEAVLVEPNPIVTTRVLEATYTAGQDLSFTVQNDANKQLLFAAALVRGVWG